MEQAEKQMPEKIMNEIVRLFNKLEENNKTKSKLEIKVSQTLVEDSLVHTSQLLCDNKVIAENKLIDDRPLEQIKTELETEKTRIEEQKTELIDKLDSIITVVDKVDKK